MIDPVGVIDLQIFFSGAGAAAGVASCATAGDIANTVAIIIVQRGINFVSPSFPQ